MVKKVLLVQPSFASAERVFSIMKNFFTNQQDAALEQTVEASVMLYYNQNQRNKLVVVLMRGRHQTQSYVNGFHTERV